VPSIVISVVALLHLVAADGVVPRPAFQNDFFGEMPRAFGFVAAVDAAARTMTVKLDKGNVVTLPIRDDTELRFRDSWGELGDYFAGQRVMLFMYVDDDRKWTYPRAVQDEIQMTIGHKWWGKITRIDRAARTYSSVRQEKNAQGAVTREIAGDYLLAPDAIVRKGAVTGGIELLAEGDEVLQQQVERGGKRVVVEVFDRAGGQAIRAVQEARHRADEDRLGLPAYVTDVEVMAGGVVVTVPWSSAARARELAPGATVTMQPADGGKPFAAEIGAGVDADQRRRVQLVVNARAAARMSYGQRLRLFVPGTGPPLPTGRAGLPLPRLSSGTQR
jgi:hypothetical protein